MDPIVTFPGCAFQREGWSTHSPKSKEWLVAGVDSPALGLHIACSKVLLGELINEQVVSPQCPALQCQLIPEPGFSQMKNEL